MGTGLQRDYVLNGMSTYIFFMSFVGDGSIVSTFFAVITTGDNASKTGKILWVGNSAENYVSLTDGADMRVFSLIFGGFQDQKLYPLLSCFPFLLLFIPLPGRPVQTIKVCNVQVLHALVVSGKKVLCI